jgi:redox-sensitive bicupin YhaK (pirin superfamily)
MIERRAFADLGGADHGWLKAKHHFSFAGYYEPTRMGWGSLRVWNDDEIAAQSGFPPHPHADMESSPTCATVRSLTRTRCATPGGPKPVTYR